MWCRYALGGLATAVAAGSSISMARCEKDNASSTGTGYFDPEALERAAKAAREIEKNKYAKNIYEQVLEQERTKQGQDAKERAQAEAAAARAAVEQEQVRWQQQREAQKEQAQLQAQLSDQNHKFAQERQQQEHEAARARNQEMVKLQEESNKLKLEQQLAMTQQIEAEKTAAEKKRMEMQKELAKAQSMAEWEARGRERRENWDLHQRELVLGLQERGKAWVSVARAITSDLGSGVGMLLSNPTYMGMLVGGTGGVFGFYFGSKYLLGALGSWLTLRLTTPPLVRETSRRSFMGLLTGAQRTNQLYQKAVDVGTRDMKDIILPRAMHDHIRSIAAFASNTRAHGAPFRHMLFHGPPGTGKTLVARRIARTSGLDYAIMSGGDIAPLAGRAVTQLHDVFDWAQTSSKGLVLFIDEADAFLGARDGQQSEGLRSALNATLFRTGDQSKDFMLILATNRPSDLDKAVLDRVDELIDFDLPGPEERESILGLYFQQYILQASPKSVPLLQRLAALLTARKAASDAIRVQGIGPEHLAQAAQMTDGFSGRELAKLMASVQAAAYGKQSSTLTPDTLLEVVQRKVAEHGMRLDMERAHDAEVAARLGNLSGPTSV